MAGTSTLGAPVVTAAAVIIGDELLAGTFADENAGFLIGELRRRGVALRRIEFVADLADDIAERVSALSARYTYVFTSGGVGPTHDDITIESIARGFAVPVVRHPDLLAKVEAYWGARLAPANRRLADVPEGARLIYGSDPTWPVVAFGNVYILPGVPALFRKKFLAIAGEFAGPPLWKGTLTFATEEGALAEHLNAVVAAHPAVKLGSYPRFSLPSYSVLVTFEGFDPGAVQAAMDDLVAGAGTPLGQEPPAAAASAQNLPPSPQNPDNA